MVLKNKWKMRQLDYVLAFPQAPAEREMYMKIPKGIRVDSDVEYVLKVEKNLYGQKQAGRVWNRHLVQKLIQNVGFRQSEIDECLFYKGKAM
jgi:Reverse transcriptase (RNA-dependent DNA polymerase)